ncbi:MAG: hypothetical protein M3R38_26060 [Actinomycetota bacterium]|nr:hypothetical protein [Actinomycetota bacterium]
MTKAVVAPIRLRSSVDSGEIVPVLQVRMIGNLPSWPSGTARIPPLMASFDDLFAELRPEV